MKLIKYIIILCAACLFGVAIDQVQAQSPEAWTGACNITFSGDSTLHEFAGTVKAEPFKLLVTNPADPKSAQATGKVVVKAAKMDTGNKKRDKKMHAAMNVSTYPDIIVDIETLTAGSTKPVTGEAVPRPTVIPFTLLMNGKKQSMIGKVSGWSYSEKEIGCTVSFPVSLSASGIHPPSVLGVVKVDDTIQVKADLHLKR